MKKVKQALLLVALGVCSVIGASVVNAAADDFFTVTSTLTIVCDPMTLMPGDTAKCYLAAKPDEQHIGVGSPGTATVHGFVSAAFVTKDLVLTGAAVNPSITDASADFTHASTGTGGSFTAADAPNEIKTNIHCGYNAEWANSRTSRTGAANDYACAVFYTKQGATVAEAFSPTSLKSNTSYQSTIVRDYTDYGVIGYYTVQLPADSTNNGSCGEICVKAWGAKTIAQYALGIATDGSTTPGSADTPRQDLCVEIGRGSSTGNPGHVPDTGAFTSYIVLTAGALIAIGAIAIAKKNNKFSRI